MKCIVLTLLAAVSLVSAPKRITIQVVSSEAYQQSYTYTTAGQPSRSQTNCRIGIDGQTVNCQTVTTPATAPTTGVQYGWPEVRLRVIMPDGAHLVLHCQRTLFRACARVVDAPTSVQAEVDGKTVYLLLSDPLTHKVERIKYRYVEVWGE